MNARADVNTRIITFPTSFRVYLTLTSSELKYSDSVRALGLSSLLSHFTSLEIVDSYAKEFLSRYTN